MVYRYYIIPSLTLKQNKCPQHVYVDLHETNKTEDK